MGRRRGEEWKPNAGVPAEETEGVFLLEDGRVRFAPVQIGIAGAQHFEVLAGLEEGDLVVTGPFDSVRDLMDGDRVRLRKDDDGSPGNR
jgi:HlyD family secretion protein